MLSFLVLVFVFVTELFKLIFLIVALGEDEMILFLFVYFIYVVFYRLLLKLEFL